MNKAMFIALSYFSLFCATVSVAQECGTNQGCGMPSFWNPTLANDYVKFRCKFIEAVKNYIAVVNMLPTREHHPSLPVLSDDDGTITSLRKVALQFQDLRLRHDTLTGFTFNSISRPARNVANTALQELFINLQNKLRKIADSEEDIAIHGYEIAVSYSLQMMVLELRKELETIANYKDEFAPIVAEAIFAVIDPYLLEYTKMCKPSDKTPLFARDFVTNSRGFMEE